MPQTLPSLALALLLASSACKTTPPAATAMPTQTYTSLLPCADCAGIATSLTLGDDGTFRLDELYLGKPGATHTSTGAYTRADRQLSLKHATGSPGRVSAYRQVGQTLQQLSLDGAAVTGPLADRYVLRPFGKTLQPNERHYWIGAAKVPCEGVGPMNCLQVARGNGPDGRAAHGEWQNFYSQIQGFDFQPGPITHLVVRETERDPATVPADASSIAYELVRVVATYGAPTDGLHDIWALDRLNGEAYQSTEGNPHPTLELNLTEMTAMGTDGCNNFRGSIAAAGASELRFGALAGMRKLCPRVQATADAFNRALNATRGYRREGLALVLLDESGAEVMALRKVD